VGGTDRTTNIPFGWIRPQGGAPPIGRRYIYGGPPAGPFARLPGGPGGGPPGRGPPGGGPPGGGPPMPIPPAPAIGGVRNDKLVGNTPLIFTGEQSKAEEFIMQWQLYEGVNITNDLMRNTYQRAMLFLTYIQGPVVNEWVKGVNTWLRGQIINQRWAPTDEQLWNEVFDSFNRQFTNVCYVSMGTFFCCWGSSDYCQQGFSDVSWIAEVTGSELRLSKVSCFDEVICRVLSSRGT
jgi:hypothetical protein